MGLTVVWFVLVALFWTGFFVLEGFDFGVGMLHRAWAAPTRSVSWRRQLDRAAVGRQRGLAHRRAAPPCSPPSPGWYATLFSALYLAARPAARRAHRPRRLVRVPGQAGVRHGGGAPGACSRPSAASSPRS